MKTMMMVVGAVLLTGLGAAFWGFGIYNGLIEKDETVNAAWAQVQNVYQRRLDLVPNLVETVKGAAKFERDTLREVAQARAAATGLTMDSTVLNDTAKFEQFEKAQGSFGGALGRLLVSMEKYPDLKSNANFVSLQEELRETEDRIAVERHNFNEVAGVYNAAIRKMPTMAVARKAGLGARPYFKAEESAATAPKVKF
jgi:LemA protein